ncbi:MAG: hypothetical protein K8S24_03895 [Candidatus Aegiribacteria sp.]|nr:hypothetical protein [Candidatus Aegiribacteria sp.]
MNNDIEIFKGNEIDFDSDDLAELIYESFKDKISVLKIHKEIVIEVIKESYNLSNCFLASSDKILIGVIGFTSNLYMVKAISE